MLLTSVTSKNSCWDHSSAQFALVAYVFFETPVRVREREDPLGRDLRHRLGTLERSGPRQRAGDVVALGKFGLCKYRTVDVEPQCS